VLGERISRADNHGIPAWTVAVGGVVGAVMAAELWCEHLPGAPAASQRTATADPLCQIHAYAVRARMCEPRALPLRTVRHPSQLLRSRGHYPVAGREQEAWRRERLFGGELRNRLYSASGHGLAEGLTEGEVGNQGNFAPVKEETAPCSDDLRVEGTLPLDLAGVFARVGPNPKEPAMGNYHWFDGDGMVHAVRIQDGRVTYTSHWVQTSKLLQVRQGCVRDFLLR
jgi:hypothetical protein